MKIFRPQLAECNPHVGGAMGERTCSNSATQPRVFCQHVLALEVFASCMTFLKIGSLAILELNRKPAF